jgi:hypothetical protein
MRENLNRFSALSMLSGEVPITLTLFLDTRFERRQEKLRTRTNSIPKILTQKHAVTGPEDDVKKLKLYHKFVTLI